MKNGLITGLKKNQTHDFWTEALARATHYCTALNIFATSVFNFIAKMFQYFY